MYVIRETNEIEDTIDRALQLNGQGRSNYPGMTYEQGVEDALRWVLNQSGAENPMDE